MPKLFLTNLKMLFRNRQALFWSIMFPLMFTVIFGLFFGKESNLAGTVALVDKSDTELANNMVNSFKDAGIFNVKDETDIESVKKEVDQSKISAVIIVPENFGSLAPEAPKNIQIYYDAGSSQSITILSNFFNQYLIQSSFAIQNSKPLFTVDQEGTGSDKKQTYFDFFLAGVLGLALMNGSIIGIAISISKYRQDKILKRITTTPLPTWKFVISEVTSRLVLNVIQISAILLVGLKLFHGHFYGNLLIIYILALFGGLLFQSIGFVIASFSKTEDAAQGMAQAITIPMMFLGGVFFPIDALPKWLGSAVQFLPLAPLLRMLRGVALDGASPFANPVNAGIVAGWIILALIVAIWKFRLTEE